MRVSGAAGPESEKAVGKGAAVSGIIVGEIDSRNAHLDHLDRYPHWEDFRHRAGMKGNLTAEQQWTAIRMGRAFRSQPIPLCDLRGKPFTFFHTQKAFEILHEIDLHCGGGACSRS